MKLNAIIQARRIVEELESQKLYHVRSQIYIHERSPEGSPPCDCCGAKRARIKRIEPDLDLLIDPITQDRKLRTQAKDKQTFDQVCADAKRFDIILRCTEETYPLLVDETSSVIAAIGAARSGKSQISTAWLARQWILKGGKDRLFMIVGAEEKHAHIIKEKLILSDQGDPSILPTELCISFPRTARVNDKHIHMIDGSKILVTHATAKSIKGNKSYGSVLTEASEVRDQTMFSVLLGRHSQTDGCLFLESSPKSNHSWLKSEVIKKAAQQTEKQESDTDYIPSYSVLHMPLDGNVWLTPEQIQRLRDDTVNDLMMRREVDGQFADEHPYFWEPFWNAETKPGLVIVNESFDPTDWGYLDDITREVSIKIFTKPHDWLVGTDCNIGLMSSMVCKIFGDAKRPDTWRIVVADHIWTRQELASGHSRKLKSLRDKRFKGAGVIMDVNSVISSHYKQINANVPTDASFFQADGFEVRAPLKRINKDGSKSYWNGERRSRHLLLARLMRDKRIQFMHGRCGFLFHSFENQEAMPDGSEPKNPTAHKDHDLASPIDALTYLLSAIFSKEKIKPNSNADD